VLRLRLDFLIFPARRPAAQDAKEGEKVGRPHGAMRQKPLFYEERKSFLDE